MNKFENNFTLYIKKIASKWVLWISVVLNILGIIAQVFSVFYLPSIVFLFITLIGFLWSGYQVYKDITAKLPPELITPPLYELLPLSFTIDLLYRIPQIEVFIYVVNYQARELNLQSLVITNFYINNGGLNIQSIPMHTLDVKVQPKQSVLVKCHRNLIQSEVDEIKKGGYGLSPYATFLATPRANVGSKQIYYNVSKNLNLDGQIISVD